MAIASNSQDKFIGAIVSANESELYSAGMLNTNCMKDVFGCWMPICADFYFRSLLLTGKAFNSDVLQNRINVRFS